MSGQVLVSGRDTAWASVAELAQKVGLVFQSPDDQLFCGRVGDEVAFGPNNLGLKADQVENRVRQALDQVGMPGKEGISTITLSGGQKQRVAIASQLSMRPLILALDEPISQLDPTGAAEVLAVLRRLVEQGMAVLLVEHRISEAMRLARRVLVMDQGSMVLETERSRLPEHVAEFQRLGLQVPDEAALAAALGLGLDSDWRGLVAGLADRAADNASISNPKPSCRAGRTVVEMNGVGFTYPGAESPALREISLSIGEGEVLGLMGANGSGKSTLLSIMAGLNRPSQGQASLDGKTLKKGARCIKRGQVALLFQNPDLLLIEPSVQKELGSGPRYLGRRFDGQRLAGLAEGLGIAPYLDLPPWALSKGQRLRVALAALMAMQPEVLLLDEPTTGQNRLNIQRLLSVLTSDGALRATVICSHDLDTLCRFAHRLVILHEGRVLAQGPTREIVAQPDVLATAGIKPTLSIKLSHQLGRNPPWLTCREMLDSLQAGQHREAPGL
jgi:energy-coupling factor transport system ATP-binding protein